MRIIHISPPHAPPMPQSVVVWLALRRQRRNLRRVRHKLGEQPPHVLNDVGLLYLWPEREDGGRSLDDTHPQVTALSSWQW